MVAARKRPSAPSPRRDAPRADLSVVYRDPRLLAPYERNARTHSPEQIEQVKASIREFGFTNPVLLKDDNRTIGAGHARTQAALQMGLARIPTITLPGLNETQWRAYVIADNKLALNAGWDEGLLKLEMGELQSLGFELTLTGFSLDEIGALGAPPADANSGAGSLAEKFMIAPFSVLNAREGWWQDRKRAWLALGIMSELGRGENALGFSDTILQPDPAKRRSRAAAGEESKDLRGAALALRTTTDPYRNAAG